MLMPLLGGIFIGLSAAGLLLFKGRIAGICGMIFSLLSADNVEKSWRVAFILSLIIATFVTHFLFAMPVPTAPTEGAWHIALSGLILGIGSFLANGCTSGHGVCGIGRGSIRSIVATITFMFTGVITVTLLRVMGG